MISSYSALHPFTLTPEGPKVVTPRPGKASIAANDVSG